MRIVIFLCITILTLVSCGDETEFNTPSLQGNKDGNLWRAQYFSADIDSGGFLVEGGNQGETLQLVTSNDTTGTFNLGGDNTSVVIFKDLNGRIYSTANAPDPSLSLYPADGQIIVEQISDSQPRTITGTFWFNAFTEDGLHTVNFNEGVFYNVSVVGGLIITDDETQCEQASQAASLVQLAYEATDVTMPDYTDVCNAYKAALNAKIASCGDENGSILAIVESLGDCIP